MAKKGAIFLNLAAIGPVKARAIAESLKDIDDILCLTASRLAGFPFLSRGDIDNIISLKNTDSLEQELEAIKKNKLEVIDLFSPAYPYLLRQISSPPLVLYISGRAEMLNKDGIAVVGSRESSDYGRSTAFDFAYKLSCLGLVVVSGLARGIDTAAHRGAVEAGRPTVAVLGSGLKRIYPHQNQQLAGEIARQGAVISEYPLNTAPLSQNFPRRNRIISGLARGVMVVEAGQRSGALITANFAVSQNREVFAVPGRIDGKQSKGPNSLIKEGAKLTESVEDVLEELNLSCPQKV